MIDICPVGALTSKPFRYSARTWEMSRRRSVSPHDSTGANLIVQVKNNKVMRVVPFENEDVNECWIADRDRFSYEALNSAERLTKPMLKQGGQWQEVDWQTALEYVANGLHDIRASMAPAPSARWSARTARWKSCSWPAAWCAGWAARTSTTACAMPNSPPPRACAGWAPRSPRWAVAGGARRGLQPAQGPSAVRRAHPPGRASRRASGGASPALLREADAWAMPLAASSLGEPGQWPQLLADVAAAVAAAKGVSAPAAGTVSEAAQAVAKALRASARPCCWATPRRSIRPPAACWRWPNGSASRPAPAWAT
jgi:NADH-quinone oxidoreductase subunit G